MAIKVRYLRTKVEAKQSVSLPQIMHVICPLTLHSMPSNHRLAINT
jgi:hypothetical protein